MPVADAAAQCATEFEDCVGVAEWTILPPGNYHSPNGIAPYAAKTSLDLDVFSDLLYFLSRGPFTRGALQFSSQGTTDNVKVDVTFFYTSPEIVQHAKICVLQRDEVNNGIGIFTSPHLETSPTGSATYFSILVELPEAVDDEPIPYQIDGLLAIVPLFSITILDPMNMITFRSVTLQTSNSPVNLMSLVSETAEVTTSNASIEGDFTCTESLLLLTSNGPINASATLSSSDPSKPAQLSMHTSNSPITAQISLVSTLQGGTGSSFKVTTKTTNAPLDVTFTTAPLDSVLQFEGSTSNSPAHATLHHTYEGDLYLSSGGMMAPMIRQNNSVQDPARRGRRRVIQLTPFNHRTNQGTLEGKVRWGTEAQRPLGSVEFTTSNGPMTLVL